MPQDTYVVTSPDGKRTVEMTQDHPPTGAEIKAKFASAGMSDAEFKQLTAPKKPETEGQAMRRRQQVDLQQRYSSPTVFRGQREEMSSVPHMSGREIVTGLANTLPVVGAGIGGSAGAPGGPVTAVGGATLGAAGGEAWRQNILRWMGDEDVPHSAWDAAKDIAIEGAKGGATQAGGEALTMGGRWVGTKAIPLVRAAVKPTVTALRQQAGASREGLDFGANRMARDLLDTRFRTPGDARAAVRSSETNVQSALNNAPQVLTLDTAERVPRYLQELERQAAESASGAPAGAVREAAADVPRGALGETRMKWEEVVGAPTGNQSTTIQRVPTRVMSTNVAPAEGLKIGRATGRWENRKAFGELKGAEQEVMKTVERATRDSVKAAVPETIQPLTEQARAMRLLPILDRMALRQGNRDVMGLPAFVLGAGGQSPAGTVARMGVGNILRNGQLEAGYMADNIRRVMASGNVGRRSADTLRSLLLLWELQGGEMPPEDEGTPPPGQPPATAAAAPAQAPGLPRPDRPPSRSGAGAPSSAALRLRR